VIRLRYDKLADAFASSLKEAVQEQMDLRFKHMDFKFNILTGISLLGFSLLNQEFINLIKMLFR